VLIQPTLGLLRRMKLQGMADALQHQAEQPQLHQLSFEDRFALLVDAERAHRDQSRIKRLLRQAQFRQQASLEDINWRAGRGLDRSLMASLASCDWIRQALNLILTGSSGVGKSWIAEACGQAACRQGLSVRYERTHRFLEALRLAHADGTYSKRLAQLAKIDLLILDDLGLKPLQPQERHDLLEVIEDRHGRHATIITSQLPPDTWHQYLQEATIADAILDRIFHRAHRIELQGPSLRNKKEMKAVVSK
jgi:DNA replication protein DnaC